ncbi:MAG: endolytic transglycosylase MltG [Maricaulaceae bacterium]
MVAVAGLLGLLAASGAWGGWLWFQHEITRPGPFEDDRVFTLALGSGTGAIAAQLETEGLVRDQRLFRAYALYDGGAADLKAGEFRVPAQASLQSLYALIRAGQVVDYPITLPEGLTSAQIIRRLDAETEILRGTVEAPPAEGALLPDTYRVTRGTERQALVDRMVAAQDALIAELWPKRAPDLPFETPQEAIILASIVEKETGLAAERPLVASVFVNRLKRGMRLESDPTIIYGLTQGEPLGRGIRRSELDRVTAYNTYHIDGLPPTPIANPGRDAIAAVLNPPDSAYLFFVADGTGGHAFAATLREHNRNVAAWRRIERARR